MPPAEPRARRDLAWTLLGLTLLAAWDASGLDLALTRAVGGAHGFAWQHAPLAATLHRAGRWLAALAVAALALGLRWPAAPWMHRLPRAERAWWLLTTLLCLLLVPALKQASATSCPRDLAEFGGVARWVSHWAWGLADGGPGHCFPSGHAAAAFAFFAGYFALRDTAPRPARAWLAGVLLLGAGYAALQLLRGAHHASHSGWTAWFCWTLSAASHRLWRTVAALRTAPPGSPVRGPVA